MWARDKVIVGRWLVAVLLVFLVACDQKTVPATPSIDSLQSDASPAITLKWSVVASAKSYVIERRVGVDGSFTLLTTALSPATATTALSYTDSSVSYATQYFYRIKSVGDGGSSGWAERSITTPTGPDQAPGVPQNFAATVSGTQIVLSWQAPTVAVGQYLIQRRANAGSYAALAQTPDLTYTDSSATASIPYQYRIKATNSVGESDWIESSAVTVGPTLSVPGLPSAAVASAVSSSQVQIAWQAPATGGAVASYTLQRQLANGSFGNEQTISQASFTDTDLTSARTYTYRVRANNAAGSSDWILSNAVPVPDVCANRTGNEPANAPTKGCFGPVVPWQLVPTFSALLPNGRIIGWYASDDSGKYREHTVPHNQQPRNNVLYPEDGTMVAVFDPNNGQFQDASFGRRDSAGATDTKGTDLFCAGFDLMSDGRFFTAGGNMGMTYGSIRTNIYDPTSNTWAKGPDTTVPDMWRDRWYPTVTKLPDGKLLISGGTAMADTTFKDGQSDPACPTGGCPVGLEGTGNLADDASKRGIKGGFNNAFEIYDPGGNGGKYLRMLQTNASVVPSFEHYYPWWHVATNGMVFLAGAGKDKGYLDVNADKWYGPYSTDNSPGIVNPNPGYYNDAHRVYGTSVMYEPGKVMIFGGGYAADGDATKSPTVRNNWAIGNTTINITLGNPSVAPTMVSGPKMSHHRTHANATLMADGKIFVNGGQEDASDTATWFNTVNPLTVWNTDLAVYDSDIWTPSPTGSQGVGQFIQGPKAAKPRMYHSVAMLLPDATVFTGAGGGCGFCNAASTYGVPPEAWGSAHNQPDKVNQKSHEIYYPSYLFKGNGSLAARPIIQDATAPVVGGFTTLAYNSTFNLSWVHPEAGHSIGKVTFVALGAPTHSFNENQRFLELPILSTVGNSLTIQAPKDGMYTSTGANSAHNVAPPGFYMLFILDDKGVPSVAKIVRIQ